MISAPPAVFVLSGDPDERARIVNQLGPGVVGFDSAQDVVAAVCQSEHSGTVVLVTGPSMSEGESSASLTAVQGGTRKYASEVHGIALRHQLPLSELKRILGAGFCDAVEVGEGPAQLRHAVRRAGLAPTTAPGHRGAGAESVSSGPPPRVPGRIVAVISAKGGVGKSVLTVNLAEVLASLAREADSLRSSKGAHREGLPRVIAVDSDLQFGDLGTLSGLAPGRTLCDVGSDADFRSVDPISLERLVAVPPSASIGILAVSPDPANAELVPSALLVHTLRSLAAAVEWIVVDLSTNLDDSALDVIDVADHALVVTSPEATSVVGTGGLLAVLERLGVDSDRRSILVNRVGMNAGMDLATIEAHLGESILAAIPEDEVVGRSVLTAQIAAVATPRAPFVQSVLELAADLSGHDPGYWRSSATGAGAGLGRWVRDVLAPRRK